MEDKIKEKITEKLEIAIGAYQARADDDITSDEFRCYIDDFTSEVLALFPKAGEDGLAENPYENSTCMDCAHDNRDAFTEGSIAQKALNLFPKAGEDGLLTTDNINNLLELEDGNNHCMYQHDIEIAKAQKALDDKRWIEGIEKIAEIRFELEEHGKIVDKLYQFTDRSWQELKTEEK